MPYGGDVDGAGIWRISPVPAPGSGRIDGELSLKAGLLDCMAKYAFGERGPADITKADKQDRNHGPHKKRFSA